MGGGAGRRRRGTDGVGKVRRHVPLFNPFLPPFLLLLLLLPFLPELVPEL